MRTEESIIPDRPAFEHTVALQLARLRAPAAFALWSLDHGGIAESAWSACPRPDWLVEAIALTGDFKPGSPRHRLLVRVLVQAARKMLAGWQSLGLDHDRERLAERATGLLDVVERWSDDRVTPTAVIIAATPMHPAVAGMLRALASASKRAPRSAEEQTAMRNYGAVAAPVFVALSVSSPSTAVTAAMTLACMSTGNPVCSVLANEIRASFSCPDELWPRSYRPLGEAFEGGTNGSPEA